MVCMSEEWRRVSTWREFVHYCTHGPGAVGRTTRLALLVAVPAVAFAMMVVIVL
jgi:hypothetical protein